MKFPRVRFTVRLLILVILFALGFGGTRWAMELQMLSTKYSRRAFRYETSGYVIEYPELSTHDPVARDKLVRHIALLRKKYEYAARNPWFRVDPDPPEPIEAQKLGIKLTIDPDVVEAPDPRMGVPHPPRFE
jgi:hypothetical protein